jgi:cell division protein FtsI (penicillin-binding protein 3)
MQRDAYLVRLCFAGLALLAGFIAVTVHLYHLQLIRHEELLDKARAKYTAELTESGQRGLILDVHGNLLAGNLACRDVLAEPRRFSGTADHASMARILSEALDADVATLLQRFDSGRIEVPVKRGVDIESAEHLAGYHFAGLRFVDTYRRYYPKGALAAHVIGFLDTDGGGVSGIENLLDDRLKPRISRELYERDRKGRRLADTSQPDTAVRDGANIYLTIDEPIQNIVEEELAAMVERHKPKAAYAIMADPKTGAILAMAQYPGFDPNVRAPENMSEGQWQNRMLTHGFEPGSILKCISIAGAIDYGVVTLQDVFDCEDGYWIHCGRPLRDSGHQYGKLRVWQILERSSNIGTAKISIQMGEGRLFQTLKRFGFGEPTGLGFANEAPGIFRPLAKWDGLSISRFPIGQGILVTPLQIVQAYCALANQGVMMQLHLVDRIEDPVTGITEITYPQVKRRTVRPETARQVVAAMQMVTKGDGTALKAAVAGYEVAGKTGTAQKFVDGTYESRKYVASFAGFVPAQNPAFVLLVVADEPSENGYYGGTVAAPVFSRIAEKTLRYLQIAPATREWQKATTTLTVQKGAGADASTATLRALP